MYTQHNILYHRQKESRSLALLVVLIILVLDLSDLNIKSVVSPILDVIVLNFLCNSGILRDKAIDEKIIPSVDLEHSCKSLGSIGLYIKICFMS